MSLTAVPSVPAGETPSASYWRARALHYLALITVRAMRAGRALIVVGYEPEALAFTRMQTEALGRARRVFEDASGEYAKSWLDGKAGKSGKVVSQDGSSDYGEMLSHASHADPHKVELFSAITTEEGHLLVPVPERRPQLANATLTLLASEARDMALILGRFHDLETTDALQQLDADLRSAFDEYLGDGDLQR